MTKKITIIILLLLIGWTANWFLDPFHKPVETVNELVGQNLDYAIKSYFHADPDKEISININRPLNEFQGGILTMKNRIKDSIVNQYTWTFFNHNVTIWSAHTDSLQSEIIDAIRYKDNVKF